MKMPSLTVCICFAMLIFEIHGFSIGESLNNSQRDVEEHQTVQQKQQQEEDEWQQRRTNSSGDEEQNVGVSTETSVVEVQGLTTEKYQHTQEQDLTTEKYQHTQEQDLTTEKYQHTLEQDLTTEKYQHTQEQESTKANETTPSLLSGLLATVKPVEGILTQLIPRNTKNASRNMNTESANLTSTSSALNSATRENNSSSNVTSWTSKMEVFPMAVAEALVAKYEGSTSTQGSASTEVSTGIMMPVSTQRSAEAEESAGTEDATSLPAMVRRENGSGQDVGQTTTSIHTSFDNTDVRKTMTTFTPISREPASLNTIPETRIPNNSSDNVDFNLKPQKDADVKLSTNEHKNNTISPDGEIPTITGTESTHFDTSNKVFTTVSSTSVSNIKDTDHVVHAVLSDETKDQGKVQIAASNTMHIQQTFVDALKPERVNDTTAFKIPSIVSLPQTSTPETTDGHEQIGTIFDTNSKPTFNYSLNKEGDSTLQNTATIISTQPTKSGRLNFESSLPMTTTGISNGNNGMENETLEPTPNNIASEIRPPSADGPYFLKNNTGAKEIITTNGPDTETEPPQTTDVWSYLDSNLEPENFTIDIGNGQSINIGSSPEPGDEISEMSTQPTRLPLSKDNSNDEINAMSNESNKSLQYAADTSDESIVVMDSVVPLTPYDYQSDQQNNQSVTTKPNTSTTDKINNFAQNIFKDSYNEPSESQSLFTTNESWKTENNTIQLANASQANSSRTHEAGVSSGMHGIVNSLSQAIPTSSLTSQEKLKSQPSHLSTQPRLLVPTKFIANVPSRIDSSPMDSKINSNDIDARDIALEADMVSISSVQNKMDIDMETFNDDEIEKQTTATPYDIFEKMETTSTSQPQDTTKYPQDTTVPPVVIQPNRFFSLKSHNNIPSSLRQYPVYRNRDLSRNYRYTLPYYSFVRRNTQSDAQKTRRKSRKSPGGSAFAMTAGERNRYNYSHFKQQILRNATGHFYSNPYPKPVAYSLLHTIAKPRNRHSNQRSKQYSKQYSNQNTNQYSDNPKPRREFNTPTSTSGPSVWYDRVLGLKLGDTDSRLKSQQDKNDRHADGTNSPANNVYQYRSHSQLRPGQSDQYYTSAATSVGRKNLARSHQSSSTIFSAGKQQEYEDRNTFDYQNDYKDADKEDGTLENDEMFPSGLSHTNLKHHKNINFHTGDGGKRKAVKSFPSVEYKSARAAMNTGLGSYQPSEDDALSELNNDKLSYSSDGGDDNIHTLLQVPEGSTQDPVNFGNPLLSNEITNIQTSKEILPKSLPEAVTKLNIKYGSETDLTSEPKFKVIDIEKDFTEKETGTMMGASDAQRIYSDQGNTGDFVDESNEARYAFKPSTDDSSSREEDFSSIPIQIKTVSQPDGISPPLAKLRISSSINDAQPIVTKKSTKIQRKAVYDQNVQKPTPVNQDEDFLHPRNLHSLDPHNQRQQKTLYSTVKQNIFHNPHPEPKNVRHAIGIGNHARSTSMPLTERQGHDRKGRNSQKHKTYSGKRRSNTRGLGRDNTYLPRESDVVQRLRSRQSHSTNTNNNNNNSNNNNNYNNDNNNNNNNNNNDYVKSSFNQPQNHQNKFSGLPTRSLYATDEVKDTEEQLSNNEPIYGDPDPDDDYLSALVDAYNSYSPPDTSPYPVQPMYPFVNPYLYVNPYVYPMIAPNHYVVSGLQSAYGAASPYYEGRDTLLYSILNRESIPQDTSPMQGLTKSPGSISNQDTKSHTKKINARDRVNSDSRSLHGKQDDYDTHKLSPHRETPARGLFSNHQASWYQPGPKFPTTTISHQRTAMNLKHGNRYNRNVHPSLKGQPAYPSNGWLQMYPPMYITTPLTRPQNYLKPYPMHWIQNRQLKNRGIDMDERDLEAILHFMISKRGYGWWKGTNYNSKKKSGGGSYKTDDRVYETGSGGPITDMDLKAVEHFIYTHPYFQRKRNKGSRKGYPYSNGLI